MEEFCRRCGKKRETKQMFNSHGTLGVYCKTKEHLIRMISRVMNK